MAPGAEGGAMALGTLDLLEAEKRSILEVLKGQRNDSAIWKVLLYDERGCSVLAPVIKLGDLRHHGVTLNMLLDSDRYQVADAAAIYLMRPTEDNVKHVCDDIKKCLYRSYAIEFISPVPEELLKSFAAQVAAITPTGASVINRVVDRYIDFFALAPNLFSLGMPTAFEIFHSQTSNDAVITAEINRIVDGLVSVIRTLNIRPVIKCSRNPSSIAAAVAGALDSRLKQLIEQNSSAGHNEWGTTGSSNWATRSRRTVLLLGDRSMDFQVMVRHTWTYQPLIHDVFGIDLNRVRVPSASKGEVQTYELNPTDSFYVQHSNMQYPEVAQACSSLLKDFNKKIEEIQTGGNRWGEMENDRLTKTVARALDAAPEIIQQKKSLDMHTTIATKLLDIINERELAKFFETEVQLVESAFGSKQNLFSQIEKSMVSGPGTQMDKLRLLLTLHLSPAGQGVASEINRMAAMLQQKSPNPIAGPLPDALKFLRHFETMSALGREGASLGAAQNVTATQGAAGTREGWSSMMDRSRGLLQNVKQLIPLIPIKHQCKLVKLVDEQMENSTPSDPFMTLDPFNIGTSAEGPNSAWRNCVVFMVGGGSYVESNSLAAMCANSDRRIIYGATHIYRPEEMVDQMERLGKSL